ncbi:MAG: endonuclease/exonuclease/phosphatase family protein [Candidatus Accumulibacter sp.]|nr:endonuclease/exonuclease/phosphatase family protein [Accumulibacter sp.]
MKDKRQIPTLRRVSGHARDGVIFTALFALAGWTGSWHRIAELFAHFFLQYVLALVPLTALLFLDRRGNWRWAALALLALLGCAIASFWLPVNAAPATAQATRLRLLQFNAALQTEGLARWLTGHHEEVDVILVLEAAPDLEESTKALAAEFPYRLSQIDGSPFGIALMSRHPLHDPRVLDDDTPAFPALQADIVTRGGTLRLIGIHPPPPIDDDLARWRNHFMTTLATRLGEEREAERATLVFGDFNSTVWSPHLRDFMTRTGLSDAQRGQGAVGTWPAFAARHSGLLGIPMDMMLISPGITVTQRRIGPDLGSDHLPVLTEIVF